MRMRLSKRKHTNANKHRLLGGARMAARALHSTSQPTPRSDGRRPEVSVGHFPIGGQCDTPCATHRVLHTALHRTANATRLQRVLQTGPEHDARACALLLLLLLLLLLEGWQQQLNGQHVAWRLQVLLQGRHGACQHIQLALCVHMTCDHTALGVGAHRLPQVMREQVRARGDAPAQAPVTAPTAFPHTPMHATHMCTHLHDGERQQAQEGRQALQLPQRRCMPLGHGRALSLHLRARGAGKMQCCSAR
jgi:hypothetical protein